MKVVIVIIAVIFAGGLIVVNIVFLVGLVRDLLRGDFP